MLAWKRCSACAQTVIASEGEVGLPIGIPLCCLSTTLPSAKNTLERSNITKDLICANVRETCPPLRWKATLRRSRRVQCTRWCLPYFVDHASSSNHSTAAIIEVCGSSVYMFFTSNERDMNVIRQCLSSIVSSVLFIRVS